MSSSYYINEAVFSSGGVLFNPKNRQVLLIFKEKSGEWLLPKGHIETGETIEKAAEREIFEETGYENKIERLLSVQVRQDLVDPTKNKIIFWHLSNQTNSNQQHNTQMENENFTGKWFSKEEAINMLKWDEDKRLIETAFQVATE